MANFVILRISMKRIIVFFLILIFFAGCGGRQPSEPTVETSSVTEELSVEQAIMYIYDEVFNAYTDLSQAEIYEADFDHKFMSSYYLELDTIVREIDESYPSEIGFHDYDHWIQGNDWDNLSYAIVSIRNISDNKAEVDMVIINYGQENPIVVKMVKEEGIWKIYDFIRNGVSELSEMEQYIEWDSDLHILHEKHGDVVEQVICRK